MPYRTQSPPGPSFLSQIGVKPKPKLEYFLGLLYQYGDLVKLPSFINIFFINHVDTINEILSRHPLEFTKKHWGYQRLARFIGQGLLVQDHDDWKKRRRLLQPIFHRQSLNQSVPMIVQTTNEMVKAWQTNYIANDTTFNMTREMLNLVLTISGKMLLSEDLSYIRSNLINWVNKGHSAVTRAIIISRFLPTFHNMQFYDGLSRFERFIEFLIEKRRQNPNQNADLLNLLLQAKDEETGMGLSERTIIDELKTFLVTGHETSGYALGWTWWHLLQHPEVLAEVKQEVDTVLGDRPARFEDVGRLVYLRRVIEETMRLYPPIWTFTRKNVDAFTVQNYTIPANSHLIICAYTLHRHPQYWPNPEKFDPNRFLPENVAQRPKLAYLPFGGGPRTCIAAGFAMLKMPLIIATILQKVSIENKTKSILLPKPQFSLKQNKPFWVKAKSL